MGFFLKKTVIEPEHKISLAAQGNSVHLRESTSFADIGEKGPIVEIFENIKKIPGWFNLDDCEHFYLLLAYQSILGIKGDLLEIGSYHGRSASLMASCLQPKEIIVICDAFEANIDGIYENKPTQTILLSNIKQINPNLDDNKIIIKACLSSNLQLDQDNLFRFIHIDGGHSAEQVYLDLKLCSEHILSKGIIVIDDYNNKQWPGVAVGTDKFMAENKNFSILADMNRHGALGRKLYLTKNH
jgi:hypothetical protein